MIVGKSPFLDYKTQQSFYNSNLELHAEGVTQEAFKVTFRDRFKDVRTDQYHFTRLQTARQQKNESTQDFADRCRNLAQKTMSKTNDPVAQRIHRENAERMCLASFTGGLVENIGRHVRIKKPQSMQEALTIALAVTEAERLEKTSEIFFANTQAGRPTRGSNDREHGNREAPR